MGWDGVTGVTGCCVVGRPVSGPCSAAGSLTRDVMLLPVRVVDTVGAGDAFVGGYLSEMLRGSDIDHRLLTANQVGAFACLVPGDWEGMPRRAELHLLNPSDPVSR